MLSTLLQDEIAVTRELHRLLLQEYQALKARDLIELEQVIEAKQGCIDQLQGCIGKRLSWLRQQGVDNRYDAIKTHVAAHGAADQALLHQLLAELETVATKTRQQNSRNGTIIAASRGYLQQALNILRGQTGQDCVYDRGAQRRFADGQRPFVSV